MKKKYFKEFISIFYNVIGLRCLFIGLKIWRKHGGKLLIIFQPSPHVIVICDDGIIRHGTDRKTGIWRVEEMKTERFVYWMQLHKSKEMSKIFNNDRYFS